MREMEMNTLCRLCLGRKGKLLDVFESFGILRLTAADAITELLQIQVSVGDTYPRCVCIECLSKLEDFKLFKQQCKSNKDMLDRANTRKLQVEPNEESIGESLPRDSSIKEENIENPHNDEENAASMEFDEYVSDSYEVCSEKLTESANPVSMLVNREFEDEVHTSETDKTNIPHCSSVLKSNEDVPEVDCLHENNLVDSTLCVKEEVVEILEESGSTEELQPMIKDDPLRVSDTNTNEVPMKKQCKKLDSPSSEPQSENKGLIVHIGAPRAGNIIGNEEQDRESYSISLNTEVNTYICDICGEVFECIQYLEAHMSGHGTEKLLNCESCNGVFHLNDSLKQHKCVVDVNPVSKPIQKTIMCNWCSKEFSGVSKLKVNKMNQCNHCYEAVSRKSGIESPPLDDFARPVRKKTYSPGRNLKAHTLTHSKKRSLKCTECCKAFYQKIDLIRHMRTHSGDKPFKCNECSKAFSQKSHLESHMNSHYGYRPFKCAECGNMFSRKSGVKRHMIIHSGNKPFKCNECSRSFFYKGNLKVHIMTHSRD